MVAISAAEVKSLRERTGLPMMDCKQALTECHGDAEAAVRWLRERGAQVLSKRSDRETAFGRFGIFASFDPPVGAMVELKCESSPVAQNEEFIQLANDLARQLATGPGAQTADELLDQPSPSKAGTTLRQQKDDLFNRIREVFNVGRMVRIDGPCGGYSHNAKTVAGVLVERAAAHAHGHSLFLDVPMWSGVDSPGRLWHYAGGRLAAEVGGEEVGDGTALFELGGFYRETVAFLDALAAGRQPSPGLREARQSVEIAGRVRHRAAEYRA